MEDSEGESSRRAFFLLVMVGNQGFIPRTRRNYERSSARGVRHLHLWFYGGGCLMVMLDWKYCSVLGYLCSRCGVLDSCPRILIVLTEEESRIEIYSLARVGVGLLVRRSL